MTDIKIFENEDNSTNNEILTIDGVECYEQDGTAYLKLETVARGLGFTQIKNNVEYVKWERVNKYLQELNSPQVGKDAFIPENIFYRLAMKAKNEVAERFQAKIADEVIPSIRRHGAYMTPEVIEKTLTNPDFIIKLATELKKEQEKSKMLANKIEEDRPNVEWATQCLKSNDAVQMSTYAKTLYDKESINIGRNTLFKLLRDNKILMHNNEPKQEYMKRGWFMVVQNPYYAGKEIKLGQTTLVTAKGQREILPLVKEYLGLSDEE